MKILRSLIRVTAAVLVSIAFLASAAWAVIRQPNRGAILTSPLTSAEPDLLRRHVVRLAVDFSPRNFRHAENLASAAAYIENHFWKYGARVSVRDYLAEIARTGETRQRNVVARYGRSNGPLVVVGAHYDAFGDSPGADDNASGVAGLLELARLLAIHPPSGAVELVAYSTEEPPFFGSYQMGSSLHALDLSEAGVDVTAMICLEMIGFFVEEQPAEIPALRLAYPNHGHFAAVVGRWEDRGLARIVKQCFRGATDLPVYSYSGPTALGSDLSDHRNYWRHGHPAVMVTDTADLRNPNYHTAADTPDTLDYKRMAEVVNGVMNAVLHLSGMECDR